MKPTVTVAAEAITVGETADTAVTNRESVPDAPPDRASSR